MIVCSVEPPSYTHNVYADVCVCMYVSMWACVCLHNNKYPQHEEQNAPHDPGSVQVYLHILKSCYTKIA